MTNMRCESAYDMISAPCQLEKKCQVQPPPSSAAAVVCPPEPLHHSARHLSKLFAPEYRAPLLSLIKPPQASNQKEATRKSWGRPSYKSSVTLSTNPPPQFHSSCFVQVHFSKNIPIDTNNVTLWEHLLYKAAENCVVSSPPTDHCIIGRRGPVYIPLDSPWSSALNSTQLNSKVVC